MAGVTLYQKLEEHKKTDTVLTDKNSKLESQVKGVESDTQKKLTEAEKHFKNHDIPRSIQIEHTNGATVTAEYYPTDGCVLLSRTHGARGAYGISDNQDLWIPDPSRANGSAKITVDLPSAKTKVLGAKIINTPQFRIVQSEMWSDEPTWRNYIILGISS